MVKSEYFFIPYPYISKTTYNLFKKCKYLYMRLVLDGYRPEANDAMRLGTAPGSAPSPA